VRWHRVLPPAGQPPRPLRGGSPSTGCASPWPSSWPAACSASTGPTSSTGVTARTSAGARCTTPARTPSPRASTAAPRRGPRAGDTIEAINERPYRTFEDLFFGDLRDPAPGSINRYTVLRKGERLELAVPTGQLGLRAVLRRSGPLFVMGLVYLLIGVL